MKTVFAALALAIALAGSAQAGQGTSYNGQLPGWAKQAFDNVN